MLSAFTILEREFTVIKMAKKQYQIKRLSAAFNLDDSFQRALYEHVVKRTNTSDYLKRLIQWDLEGRNALHPVGQQMRSNEQPVHKEEVSEPVTKEVPTISQSYTDLHVDAQPVHNEEEKDAKSDDNQSGREKFGGLI